MLLVRRVAFLFACLCSSAVLPAQARKPLAPSDVVLTIDLAPGTAPLRVTLAQMMHVFREPGFSVAVVERDTIAWAKGFGVTMPGGRVPVDAHTLFQAASISKPVTAAGALWLVERGKLSLDADVNTELASWRLPADSFTATQKVTLRRLLSHNAGINVPGFDGYVKGRPLPTPEQTLDGAAPATNRPIRVTAVPGTVCNYSGGGYVIVAQLIRDASGQSFEQFMRDNVLLPAGMTESTFEQQLPAALAARAATGATRDGKPLPGGWRLLPELAPDGLWTTPTDLARFAIEIARSARDSANRVLSQASVREMLTIQCFDDPTDGTGLGFALGYQGRPAIFFHNGSNAGFQSVLMMDPGARWGYAAMGNSDNFGAVNRAVFNSLSVANGWGVESHSRDLGENLAVIRALRNTATAIAYYERVKAEGFPSLRHDASSLNLFGYALLAEKRFADAIRVFRMNVAEYPQDANAYDSLGEAYMDVGQRALAIESYEKSLQLDPKNDNAAARLRALRPHVIPSVARDLPHR